MLYITIPASEMWDEVNQRFVYTKEQTLQLEHSLVSLHKWESKWCKPFLSKEGMTAEETIDYIRCMTITQNVNPNVYNNITEEQLKQVSEYINAPMTATWFSETEGKAKKSNGEIVTAEVIYYWMIALQIPPEYRKWHLNKLLTLIRVCNIKNEPPKKMGKRATMSRNAALNAARRKQLNTHG
jgi:hypothetical protein